MRIRPINDEVIGLDDALELVATEGAEFEFVPWETPEKKWVYRVFLRTSDGAQIDVLQKHSFKLKTFTTYKALYLFMIRTNPDIKEVCIPVLPHHVDEALRRPAD